MSAKKRYGTMETVLSRHETYQTGFRRQTYAQMVMAAATALAVASSWWSFTQVPETKYVLSREDGGLIPLVGVDQPYLNDNQVTNFAVEAITKAMTMSFVTWRQDLSEASEYFERPTGWNNFLEALEGSGTLDLIRNRRLISSVVANGAVITKSGLENGRYIRVVQIPITISYQSSSQSTTENRLAEVEVARLPTWQTSRAMGITRVLIK